ncbi:MAG TPA: PAS domain S-box protein [Lamprocystis sp. (in: g-proteobacteria)]|nr:PAS domain S-box protein [Lamprocystis sp. (in: g-proteobacteria)]
MNTEEGHAHRPHPPAGAPDPSPRGGAEDLRTRALKALRAGRFDLAEELLARGEVAVGELIENLRIYQAELEIQNEELRQSQRENATLLTRFTEFFTTLPVAELVVDRLGLIIESNPEAQTLFGLRDPRYRPQFFARLVAETDRDRVVLAWSGLAAVRNVALRELVFRTTKGDGFIGDLHIARLPAGAGDEDRFICAVLDRTEAARQREALREAHDRLNASEERYRILADLSPDWEYWLGPDGDFLYVSPASESISGYSAGEFMADASLMVALIHPDDRSAWGSHFTRDADSLARDAAPLSLRIVTRNGAERWIEHVCNPVIGDLGCSLGRRGVNRDITARKQAEAALQDREGHLSAIMAATPVGIGLIRDRIIQDVNPSFCEMLGYDREALIGAPTRVFYQSDEDYEQIGQEIYAQLAAHGVASLECRLRAQDGHLVDGWLRSVHLNPKRPELGIILTALDVTARVAAQQALRDSERNYRELFDATSEAILVHDITDGHLVDVNRSMMAIYGFNDKAEALAGTASELSADTPPYTSEEAERLRHAALTEGPQLFEWLARRKDGSLFWVEVSLRAGHIGGQPRLLAVVRDIDERRRSEERLRQAAQVFDSTAEGVIVTDADQQILAVNRAFTEITGYPEAEVLGQTPRILKSGRYDAAFYQAMWTSINEAGQWRGEIWNRRKDGTLCPQLTTISAVRDTKGQLTHYVGVFGDISPLKRSEAALYKLAHYDALTSLPNRLLLRARLEQCIQGARLRAGQVALLFVDLDLFKNVNDTLGHPVGDRLLQQVATAMAGLIRPGDNIARLGGDEFVLLLDDVSDPSTAASLARRLLARFAHPFRIEGQDLYITASIGISLYPVDGLDMDGLLRTADVAMYQAKAQGRNTFRFFEPAMSVGATERLHLETALRGALRREELALHYQPQVCLETQQLSGVEVLLRWQHPLLGAIPPARFIPIAEELGIIGELGAWVLMQACQQLATWDRDGFRVPRLAVNLSMQQIEAPGLVDLIRNVLTGSGIAPERLELEVTESVLMRSAVRSAATLAALREIGVTIAIDDFGSGYSSLGYLQRLPVDRLKIDRVFVEHLTEDANHDAIARAVIVLGRTLNLEVVAEGVETRAQADFLQREGCHQAQGYLFGRPVPAPDLKDAWTRRRDEVDD